MKIGTMSEKVMMTSNMTVQCLTMPDYLPLIYLMADKGIKTYLENFHYTLVSIGYVIRFEHFAVFSPS